MWVQDGCSGLFCCGGVLTRCVSSPGRRRTCHCVSRLRQQGHPHGHPHGRPLVAASERSRRALATLAELKWQTTVYEHYFSPPEYARSLGRRVEEGGCVEVLHAFSKQTNDGATRATWLWPLNGTGVFFRARNVVRFAEHFEFNLAFNGTRGEAASCTLRSRCRFVSPAAVREASRAGWETVHFTRHTQDTADVRHGMPVPKSELMDLRPDVPLGPGATPDRYYADAACSRPCRVPTIPAKPATLRCDSERLADEF